jgi:hypothetical protein
MLDYFYETDSQYLSRFLFSPGTNSDCVSEISNVPKDLQDDVKYVENQSSSFLISKHSEEWQQAIVLLRYAHCSRKRYWS